MSHVALYRKYRSQTFGDLVGQEHVVRTLLNAIKQGNVHHAYLFTGPRGTGKTSTARLMAKALNCPNKIEGEPCNTCDLCLSITEGNCMDVVEMDAASEAGVEDVRQKIVDVVEYRPVQAAYKVFIIDEVHDLSSKAFDALLKTIEEPPGHVIFILATTELHKVPPTIQSRCQKFQFNRATLSDLVKRLQFVMGSEGKDHEPAALEVIARMADGGFRDALSLLEQAVITSSGTLTLQHVIDQLGLIRDELVDELLLAVAKNDVPQSLDKVDAIYRSGRDAKAILDAMLFRLSELTRVAYNVEVGGTGEATQEAAMKATSAALGPATILRLREHVAGAMRDVRDVSLPRLWLESLLLGFRLSASPVASAQPVHQSVASSVPTAAPPTPRAVTDAAPRVQESAAEPLVAPEPPASPAVSAPTPSATTLDHPDAAEADAAWRAVVADLAAQSRIAGALLAKTSVSEITEEQVTISFARKMDLDQLESKHKLVAALNQLWEQKRGGRRWALSFRLSENASVAFQPDLAAVELPAEGARLAEMAKDVFKNF